MDNGYQSRTTVTQTKKVIRPFRLIGLICLLIALGFCIACLSTKWWAHSKNEVYYQGLWKSCRKFPEDTWVINDVGEQLYEKSTKTICKSLDPRPTWLICCIVFVFLSAVVTLLAIIAVIVSLLFGARGDQLSRGAGVAALLSIIFMMVSLVLFVTMFSNVFDQIDTRLDPEQPIEDQHRRWYFGWGYGCGWASTIFLAGASVLLLCCKKEDEIYEAEKTYVVDE